MTVTLWPFGPLTAADCSDAVLEIAALDLSVYETTPIIARELKRYFALRLLRGAPITMQSKLVDQLWHKFILDTERYRTFCSKVFGYYLDHQSAHFPLDESFPREYEEMFGEKLPMIWNPGLACGDEHRSTFSVGIIEDDRNCA